jgi:Uma2 family endonuclease
MGLTITQPLPLRERRGWTRIEFESMIELGLFAPDEKLELIEGEIVPKITPIPPHATAIYKVQTVLLHVFGAGYMVRVQLPLSLGEGSSPEPDLALVEGAPEDYSQSHPTGAILIVEVADATLLQDREVKAGLYAREGIAEY